MNPRRIAYRVGRAITELAVIPALERAGPLEKFAGHIFGSLASKPVLASDIVDPLVISGLVLHHGTRPSATVRALAFGTYEQAVARVIATNLATGRNFLDLGAHIGYHSLLAAQVVGPSGHVWAFEPNPETFAFLERNIEANNMVDRISAVQSAVGSTSGVVALERLDRDTGSAITYSPRHTTAEIRVPVTSLDSWAAANDWPRIDLIKMDIEGSEPEALAGMARVIELNPDVSLIVECQVDALARSGFDPMRLFRILDRLAFDSLTALDDRRPDLHRRLPADRVRFLKRTHWKPMNILCERAH